GVLTGTPQSPGLYNLRLFVTDANNNRLTSFSIPFVVAPAGRPAPFEPVGSQGALSDPSAGALYLVPLDRFFSGGTPPYTFVASNLPPGLSVVAGSNGLPTYLAGKPTAAGDYPAAS